MAQVNLIQYAEILLSDGRPIRIGSKTVPVTISLTGTGEVYHRVWNDVTGPSVTIVYDEGMTALKWFAIKTSIASVVAWGDAADAADTSSIGLAAGRWQFINIGTSTEAGSNTEGRPTNNATTIEKVVVYNSASNDIEFIGAY